MIPAAMFAVKMMLKAIGILIVLSSIFEAVVVQTRAHGQGELHSIILSSVLMFLCGVGFLVGYWLANLTSAFLLVCSAVWLFSHDAYRTQDWWISCLFLIPLLLTLLLSRETFGRYRVGVSNAH